MEAVTMRAVNRRTMMGMGVAAVTMSRGITAFAQTPDASPAASPVTGEREVVHAQGTTYVPLFPERVLAMGDEWILTDLLELGITPVASSSTYGDRFIGIPEEQTEGIETFSLFTGLDVEQLVAIAPDLIVVPDYVFGYLDGLYETLSQIAPTVSIAATSRSREAFVELAAVFGLEADAEAILSTLDADIAAAKAELALDGQTVTLATVYPGEPSVTLWLTTVLVEAEMLVDLGLTLVPDAEDYEVDQLGRAYLSVEQVNAITGETLIMLQTTDSDEENATYDAVIGDALWGTIPAVQNDRVFVVERIGYPGTVSGRRELLATYRGIFGA